MMNNTLTYENNSFFMVPKELLSSKYKDLSTDAKVLYSIMLDRHNLSIKNNWKDKDGNTYIIFTINSIKEIIGCGKTKAIQLLNQLRNPAIGLIKTVRRGLNKPNLIYVNNIIPVQSPQVNPDELQKQEPEQEKKQKEQIKNVPTASGMQRYQNKPKQNRFCNYEQRKWDFNKIKELERKYIKEIIKE